jgi:hypothetical protein
MYAPFPFANGDPADFATTERFEFTHDNVKCTCEVVATHFAPRGDGFAVLTEAEDSNDLVCEFVSPEHPNHQVRIPMGE